MSALRKLMEGELEGRIALKPCRKRPSKYNTTQTSDDIRQIKCICQALPIKLSSQLLTEIHNNKKDKKSPNLNYSKKKNLFSFHVSSTFLLLPAYKHTFLSFKKKSFMTLQSIQPPSFLKSFTSYLSKQMASTKGCLYFLTTHP